MHKVLQISSGDPIQSLPAPAIVDIDKEDTVITSGIKRLWLNWGALLF